MQKGVNGNKGATEIIISKKFARLFLAILEYILYLSIISISIFSTYALIKVYTELQKKDLWVILCLGLIFVVGIIIAYISYLYTKKVFRLFVVRDSNVQILEESIIINGNKLLLKDINCYDAQTDYFRNSILVLYYNNMKDQIILPHNSSYEMLADFCDENFDSVDTFLALKGNELEKSNRIRYIKFMNWSDKLTSKYFFVIMMLGVLIGLVFIFLLLKRYYV